MKLKNINELTDSREILNNGSGKFGKYVTMTLLLIVISIIIMLLVIDKEISLKVPGVVKSTEYVNNINNEYAGKIKKINIEDGDTVKRGDVLIEIDNEVLQERKNLIEKGLAEVNISYENYNRLIEYIDSGSNGFNKDNKSEEGFYYEYLYYQEGEESKRQQNESSKINSNNLKNKLQILELCIKSINNNTNYIDKSNSRYYLVKNNLSDINKLQNEITKIKEELNKELNIDKRSELESSLSEKNIEFEKFKNDILYNYNNEMEGVNNELSNIKYDEDETKENNYAKVGILEKIKSIKNQLLEYEQKLQEVNIQISNSKIESPVDGIIKLNGINEVGEYLQIGQPIGSIIGKNSKYTGYFFVPNKNIENVKIGNEVKVKISALSEKDYGFIKTNISTVSTKASLLSEQSTDTVYTMTADLNKEYLKDKNGNINYIKEGMDIEGVIISKKISYFRYIIETLFGF